MTKWFVQPETRRVALADGEWIEVKKELNVAEDRKYRAAGLKRVTGAPGGQTTGVDVDWTELALARVETYLVDWSLRGPDGKTVPYTPSAVRNLSTEAFDEIDAAILRHIEEMAEEKKATGGEPTPQPPSS